LDVVDHAHTRCDAYMVRYVVGRDWRGEVTDTKAYMAHADIPTTMIYVHHVPRHDAAGRLSRLLEESM
jgi:integrase